MLHSTIPDTIRRMRKEFKDLESPQFERAVSRALNRTASAANMASRKAIRAEYRISAKRTKQAISVSRKANPDSLRADVKASGRMIPAMEFKSGRSGKGVSVNIKGERKLLRGAFITGMKSGHVGIFARADTSGGYADHQFLWRHVRLNKRGKDLPIAEVKTLGVPKAMANRAVLAALTRKTQEKFPPVLQHELTRRMAQQRRAGSEDE